VDGVVGLLVDGQGAPGGFLDRDVMQGLGFALVAQVGQAEVAVVDPGADLGEQVGVGAAAVVSSSRPGRTSEVHSGQPSVRTLATHRPGVSWARAAPDVDRLRCPGSQIR
jgi:hypothetical protein